jgi:diguanylate cyclase (GGDEF)-like protein
VTGELAVGLDGAILDANATFLSWVGREAGDVIGRMRLQDFLTPGGRIYHQTHQLPLLLMHGSAREIALDLVGADGRRRPVLITSLLGEPGADGDQPVIRATVFEATERRAYERELQRARDRERAARERAERAQAELADRNSQLERLAYTDPLTGVGNRRALESSLADALEVSRERGRPLGVVLVDIDHFKAINDTYGHEAGDLVLSVAAQRMRGAVRRDDIVGRWGGDEFLVVAPGAGADATAAMAERVRAAMATDPVTFQRRSVSFTVSVGWTMGAGEELDALIGRADRAMYRAKQGARDRVCGTS